jgi:hypothetical protein
MFSAAHTTRVLFLGLYTAAAALAQQFDSGNLNTSGRVAVDGRSTPYLIRHLPVNAFPDLPEAVQQTLASRGCLIPQSYEAHGPENVVHGSFERAGSSDWAVLCSANGTVSLLVFFSNAHGEPATLAAFPETGRLQSFGAGGVLGFNWAIDPASPDAVREAQQGMRRPPAALDHDALADSVLDGKTIYRYYRPSGWMLVATQD